MIRKLLSNNQDGNLKKVAVHTVDSFQGSEASVVIVSMVRSNNNSSIGFLSDSRRLNVAITRAKDLLIIVGDGNTFENKNINKKIDNAPVSLYRDMVTRGYVQSDEEVRCTLLSR